jgi:predicted dehydrogenase
VETWASVIVSFEDGTRATIFSSDYVLGGMEDTLELYLSNCRVNCDLMHSTTLQAYAPDPAILGNVYLAEKLETNAGWSYPAVDEEWLLGYPQEIEDFVEAIADDRDPVSDARLGLDVCKVVYAAYQSAEEGRRIEI